MGVELSFVMTMDGKEIITRISVTYVVVIKFV